MRFVFVISICLLLVMRSIRADWNTRTYALGLESNKSFSTDLQANVFKIKVESSYIVRMKIMADNTTGYDASNYGHYYDSGATYSNFAGKLNLILINEQPNIITYGLVINEYMPFPYNYLYILLVIPGCLIGSCILGLMILVAQCICCPRKSDDEAKCLKFC